MVFVMILLCQLSRSSFVSVVFDFKASLNDFAPASPILLSIVSMRREKVNCLFVVFVNVLCLFCVHAQD